MTAFSRCLSRERRRRLLEKLRTERGMRGVAEAPEVRKHLVVGVGPYLMLAEAQYCASNASTFLAVNSPLFPCVNLLILSPPYNSLPIFYPLFFPPPWAMNRQTHSDQCHCHCTILSYSCIKRNWKDCL